MLISSFPGYGFLKISNPARILPDQLNKLDIAKGRNSVGIPMIDPPGIGFI